MQLQRRILDEDRANRALSRARHTPHFKELREVIRQIVLGLTHPYALSDFASRQIKRGYPVHSNALFATEPVLAAEARHICLAITSLKPLHSRARGWLAQRLRRDPAAIEPSIPWNLACAGQAINPTGE